ncbi:MAG TPA: DUF2267 domain-containing protein [Rickettsiales bacterium]|nr:DUF2267 domain-containing protein [Rickettsiales bacterium]
MTIPMEYQHASEAFEAFLADAKEETGLTTRNQTYTTVQAVLYVFRRRLHIADALRFADELPPLLRAIFVESWNIQEEKLPFADRESLAREVRSFRRDHNFSPDSAIADVARALRKHVELASFSRMLMSLPTEAQDFWK